MLDKNYRKTFSSCRQPQRIRLKVKVGVTVLKFMVPSQRMVHLTFQEKKTEKEEKKFQLV